MHWRREDNGDLHLAGLNHLVVDTLMRIPRLLASEDPRVRERLFPRAFADPEDQEQWQRLAEADLEHLFQDQETILRNDLITLKQEERGEYSLTIPARHQTAWLSALNAARLTLYILHRLQPQDMELEGLIEGEPEKEFALVRIHILALIQELLLGEEG